MVQKMLKLTQAVGRTHWRVLLGTPCKTLEAASHAAERISFNGSTPLMSQLLTRRLSGSSNISRAGEDVKWLHPADEEMSRREAANKQSTLLGCTCITLNAKTPLTEDKVLKTLQRLNRKIPLFRYCLRERKGQLWVCEMKSPKLDFKVVEGGDWKKEAEKMIHERYDSFEGPLWRARLLEDPGEPCTIPTLQEEYPHQRRLLIGGHLGLQSGPFILKMIVLLRDLLNDEVPEDDEGDIGHFMNKEEEEDMTQVLNMCREKHVPQLKAEIAQQMNFDHQPFLKQAYEVTDGGIKIATEYEVQELGLETSERIFKCCKGRGITVNSFMISVLNATMVEMMKEAGIEKDGYNIISRFSVDAKRYLSSDTSKILSAHGFSLTHFKETPRDVLGHFWYYASQVHSELTGRLHQKQPLSEYIIAKDRQPEDFSYEKYYGQDDHPVDTDYYFVNLTTKSDMVSGVGKKVQVANVYSLQSMHRTGTTCLVWLNTVRGYMQIAIAYSTQYMTRETSLLLLDKASSIIKMVTEDV